MLDLAVFLKDNSRLGKRRLMLLKSYIAMIKYTFIQVCGNSSNGTYKTCENKLNSFYINYFTKVFQLFYNKKNR